MHPKRLMAIGVLGLVLLVANGFAAPALWAFTAGPRAEAHITGCSMKTNKMKTKTRACEGVWSTPDGVEHRGSVPHSGTPEVGESVFVRIGIFGELYRDSLTVLWIRLAPALMVDITLSGALIAVALISRRARRRAVALDAATGPDRILWRANNSEVTDRDGAVVWSGRRDRRRLTAILASGGGDTYRVHTAKGVLRLDHSGMQHAGRVEAQRGTGKRLAFTVFDASGAPRAVIANVSVCDSRWTVTTTEGIHCADLVVAPGMHRLALTPAAESLLLPLLAAFLLDCDRMVLDGAPPFGG